MTNDLRDYHYSGDNSKQFWNRVNKIPWSQGGEAVYALGCVLQDLEGRVQRALEQAEARQIMTTNIHSLSIGQEELKQPISDYVLDQVLGGTLIPSQGLSKALARQVKELRQELSIMMSAHGEVKRGYSRAAEELALGMHKERDRF